MRWSRSVTGSLAHTDVVQSNVGFIGITLHSHKPNLHNTQDNTAVVCVLISININIITSVDVW